MTSFAQSWGVSGLQRSRHFSSTSPVYVRKVRARPAPTKAKLAAKERKRALKARKNIYEKEKMPLADAINVLRVRLQYLFSKRVY